MTDPVPDPGPTNVAGDNSHVTVQAGVVHGDVNSFTVGPDASPEEKFQKGVGFLNSGMPSRARQLIHEAMAGGHRTDEVFFYWLLAMVSGRTRNELSDDDARMLRDRGEIIQLTGDGEWADGVRTVSRFLDFAQKRDEELLVLLKDFDRLGAVQRTLILKHLELFLDGSLQDEMWDRALARAERDQRARDRAGRMWKFFQPAPEPARVRSVVPAETSAAVWVQAVTATVVLAATAVHIAYLLAQAGRVPALLACVLSAPAAYVGALNGLEWRFHTVRRRAKDEEYSTRRRRITGRPDGFARSVDRRFDHYFAKYVPDATERRTLLADTEGVRRAVRDEIVQIYREERTDALKIGWLIRHQVRSVVKRWRDGTLWSYRTELATSLPTRTRAVVALTALAGVWAWAVGEAVAAGPLSAARSTVLMLAGGWIATHAWLHIAMERRRVVADKSERERELKDRTAAFEEWKDRLSDRPNDAEMAAWLDCDRKVLLNEALRHYRLTMSDVIAYAFIEAGLVTARRARARGGPWRYGKYRLVVFLLTADGVRQVTVRLNSFPATFHDRHRTNYRYEAVAAVRVRQSDDDERALELTLVDGQRIGVQVLPPRTDETQEGESSADVSEVTLDAAGVHHTLHVLEGIAAEGKRWIWRENQRGEARAKNFAAATRGLAS